MSLRELIQENHKKAENCTFNKRMIEGELKMQEYFHYLVQMEDIFFVIENVIELPNDLTRSESIENDLHELEDLMECVSYYNFFEMLPSTKKYTNYLKSLNEEQIMPHVYLNYMALMFGGQMIKSKIHGKGKLYDFVNTSECISFIRDKQKDEWSDEVNKGFEFIIEIYDELQRNSKEHLS